MTVLTPWTYLGNTAIAKTGQLFDCAGSRASVG